MKVMIATMAFCVFALYSQGQEIPKWKITDVEKRMNAKDSGILVLNFWATFCKPCVAEIPYFIKITDKYKSENVILVLISLDLPSYYPVKIAAFAKQRKFNADICWLQETNADYFCPKIDSSWSGSIPATLILNTRTGYRKFFEGEMNEKEFETTLKAAINDTKAETNRSGGHALDAASSKTLSFGLPPVPPVVEPH